MSSIQRVTLWRDDVNKAFDSTSGSDSFATGQVAVSTTATQVVPARSGRKSVTLTPTSSTVYYVGGPGVTSSTGVYVAAGAAITLSTGAAVFAVGSAALTISFVEYF